MNTTILPISYEEDIEHVMSRDECNVIGIEEISVTYFQIPDANSSSDEYQHLTVKTQVTMSPDEGSFKNRESFYFDLSIPEGEHWSIDDGDELNTIIEDFKNRVYMTTNYKPKPEKKKKDNEDTDEIN